MTRTYATRRLLEHGPLTRREIVEITGWSGAAVSHAILSLWRAGGLLRSGSRNHGGRITYRLVK